MLLLPVPGYLANLMQRIQNEKMAKVSSIQHNKKRTSCSIRMSRLMQEFKPLPKVCGIVSLSFHQINQSEPSFQLSVSFA